MTATTIPSALRRRVDRLGAAPLLTFYDLGTGERVELSAVTAANWAAKLAGLLTDELDLERGDRVVVDLPAHWQTAVLLLGAWTAGLEVAAPGTPGPAAAYACAAAHADEAPAGAGAPLLLAFGLQPLARPWDGPLPAGAVDVDREARAMPDAYAAVDPPSPDDPAWTGGTRLDHAGLLAAPDDGRRLLRASPATDEGVRSLAGALAGQGSLVLLAGSADAAAVERIAAQERVTPAG